MCYLIDIITYRVIFKKNISNLPTNMTNLSQKMFYFDYRPPNISI